MCLQVPGPSLPRLHSVDWKGLQMNRKGFLEGNVCDVMELLSWNLLEGLREEAMIVGVLPEIRTQYIPNTIWWVVPSCVVTYLLPLMTRSVCNSSSEVDACQCLVFTCRLNLLANRIDVKTDLANHSIVLCRCYILYQLTDFHETWYERHAIGCYSQCHTF